ncbi:hypothetical protein L226DRAFT_535962 [Lentinus tigrinus ALCF2SS1-7]|uniref:Uncharacterized protein n=1 Tax=Lentinus tigrinus ALCF2SS1-6 TaxID=1328759 RepID=A0A5C2RRP9_9APHY|nr:hypothetical protein L227DRAFT_557414 [Lentinus tigrinus ALCF2SS1-6]RPD73688.1 hypothetical protein L226DRAFT_535962 [Lentinus tigrinus ALCF2SS1-7]
MSHQDKSVSPRPLVQLAEVSRVRAVGWDVGRGDGLVEGKEATGALQDPAQIASLESAVTTLHAHGFVFGDLRGPRSVTGC